MIPVAQGITVDILRSTPCNLFSAESAVTVKTVFVSEQPGDFAVDMAAVREDGVTVFTNHFFVGFPAKGKQSPFLILGKLEPGYYKLRMTVSSARAARKPEKVEHSLDFGVVPFMSRTAEQARKDGSRFGMKVWQSGDIWWNRSLTWDAGEAMQACGLMGLQWTRAALADKVMGTQELATRYPFNVVSKVECFPDSCFDEARFGPLEAYEKTEIGKSWAKSTLPKEAPYKAWLKEQVSAAPADQTVFEIWNEPWQWSKTMPAEDFAKLCNWAVSVIKEARPNAVVGPNIYGEVNAYDQAVIAAGGLDRMDFVAIHPYAAGTPEEKGFRQRIRNYHDLLRLKLGRDLDLYTTEYGWSTAPQGARVVSEMDQARLTVRESLMLYAEGVKTLIPHTLGQRQQNPKEREDYFGFFRLNNEPKPAIVAFATCARMIDGSRFVGDLWLGPGIGAMLFERDKQLTLALWTEKHAREIVLDVGSTDVTAVGLMGRSETLHATSDGLHLNIGPDVTYLLGVGQPLVQRASPPAAPMNPDVWSNRTGLHTMPKFRKVTETGRASEPLGRDGSPSRPPVPANALRTPRGGVPTQMRADDIRTRDGRSETSSPADKCAPVIDGKFDDWSGVPGNELANPKLDDISAVWRLAWDEKALYVAVEVTDCTLVNTNAPGNAAMGDAIVLQLSTRPDRQVSKPDLYDFEITIAPTSATGAPVFLLKNAAMKNLVNPTSGIRWAVACETKHWTVEAAIPFIALRAEPPKSGQKMAFALRVFDRDRTDQDEWRQWWKRIETFDKKGRACERPYLVFGE